MQTTSSSPLNSPYYLHPHAVLPTSLVHGMLFFCETQPRFMKRRMGGHFFRVYERVYRDEFEINLLRCESKCSTLRPPSYHHYAWIIREIVPHGTYNIKGLRSWGGSEVLEISERAVRKPPLPKRCSSQVALYHVHRLDMCMVNNWPAINCTTTECCVTNQTRQ